FDGLLGILAGQRDSVFRHHSDFGIGDRDAGGLQGALHRFEVIGGRHGFEDIAGVGDVIRAGLEADLDDALLVGFVLLHGDHAALMEHPGYAAGGAHVAAVLLEDFAQLGHGTVAVVGHHARHDGGAAGPVAFVVHLFVVHAFELAGPLFDGTLDVCSGHAVLARGGHRG